MKKKLLALLLAVLTLSALSGCAAKPATPAPEAAKTEKIRIALVLPATVDDLAWGQSMVEGLKAVQNTMGKDKVEIATSEKLGNAVDAGSAIRQYATQGYDIIIAHGSQYQSVLTEITKRLP
ncbi:MAG TPA: BMP family ABC transporter substrate-binding protein [Desulfosporosinus sp.]